MINKVDAVQNKLELVYIEDLVPQDLLLRVIDKYVDFTFIREKLSSYYCQNNGRLGYDPIVIFKMLFIGYWFGIKSEHKLAEEVKVNIAYRWFLGLSLTDKTPEHSTFSKLRSRKFNDTQIFQEIFDEIVFRAINLNMVSGKILYSDSTHIKANANKQKFSKEEASTSCKWYVDELNKSVDEVRIAHEQEPLKKRI